MTGRDVAVYKGDEERRREESRAVRNRRRMVQGGGAWCACLALIASAWCAAPASAQAGVPADTQIKEIEQAILSHRRAIIRGHVRVTRKTEDAQRGSPPPDEMTNYFDGVRVREDQKMGDAVTLQCYGDEYFYWYCTGRPTTGGQYALTMKSLSHTDRKQHYVHDPTMLMLYPLWYEAAQNFHKESLINSPDRTDLRLAKADWQGNEAWKISFLSTKSGTAISYWVVPAWGYNVVRIEMPWKSPDGEAFMDSVEASLQHVRDEIWFPKSTHYQRVSGTKVMLQETLGVEVVSLNEPIDPGVFTPAGMNVPAGTAVSRIPADPRGALKWTGKQIVVMSREEIIQRMTRPKEDADSWLRVMYLSISVILAVAGCSALWWRQRRKSSDAAQ